jgi:hypothetical protein
MNRDVFLSLLALDSYNRGYGEVVFTQPRGGGAVQNEAGRTIGNATIVDVPLPQGSLAAGFYAIAYDWNGETVISYRGTNVLHHFVAPDLIRGLAFLPCRLNAGKPNPGSSPGRRTDRLNDWKGSIAEFQLLGAECPKADITPRPSCSTGNRPMTSNMPSASPSG